MKLIGDKLRGWQALQQLVESTEVGTGDAGGQLKSQSSCDFRLNLRKPAILMWVSSNVVLVLVNK